METLTDRHLAAAKTLAWARAAAKGVQQDPIAQNRRLPKGTRLLRAVPTIRCGRHSIHIFSTTWGNLLQSPFRGRLGPKS
jgi:hypothetical protein